MATTSIDVLIGTAVKLEVRQVMCPYQWPGQPLPMYLLVVTASDGTVYTCHLTKS